MPGGLAPRPEARQASARETAIVPTSVATSRKRLAGGARRAGVSVDLDARDIDRHRAVNVLRRHCHASPYTSSPRRRASTFSTAAGMCTIGGSGGPFLPHATLAMQSSRERTPNYQPPIPKRLPIPNRQLPTTFNWQLGVGSGWALAVGNWELRLVHLYCEEAIAGRSRVESEAAVSVGPRRPTSGVLKRRTSMP